MTRLSLPKLQSWLPLLTICLLCAVAITPLLRSDSPCTHDGAFHTYRVAAMRHALESEKILFTRYLPDLAFGHGYPFFNYRAPLSYYLALFLHLTGLPLPMAFNLLYAMSIVGSAVAAYLLARDLFGPRAGVIAAVAYAYAPYQFLDALLRANMPESVALPLMPLALWAFRRLALTGQRRWFAASIGSLAALYLTHNISSLLFTPYLLAFLGMLWLTYRRKGHWIAVGSAFALALGLTAFFWGPALMEQDYAQLHMSRVTRNNDFHYNFLGLAEIFAPSESVDTSLLNPPMKVHLGLTQVILAGAGLVVGTVQVKGKKRQNHQATEGIEDTEQTEETEKQRNKEHQGALIFLAVSAVFFIFMSTRYSLWLWEHVPLIPFVQFPWRMIGRAILPISLLAGAVFLEPSSAASAPQPVVSRVLHYILYAAIALLVLTSLPSTYSPYGYCPSPSYPSIGDVFAYEHRSTLVGVDPEGSYFPIWVKQRPDPEIGSPLEEQYESNDPVARFDETVLPVGATVVAANYGPNRAHIVVETPSAFRARYLAFYFPGWQVRVDGLATEIVPTNPQGFIAFDVPAGKHTITIRFGSTPVRAAFSAASLVSLIACLIISLRYPPTPSLQPSTSSLRFTTCGLVIGIAALLLTFKLAVVDRTNTLFRYPHLQPDGALPGVEHPLYRRYADGMTLIGYDQGSSTIPTDSALRLDFYWSTYAQPANRYQTVVHLVDRSGMRWSHTNSFRPRGYAKYPSTNTWPPGLYAIDSHEVEPLAGTPPGIYDVVLTVFDRDTLAPLSVLNEQGQPAAPELTLSQVTLSRPHHPTEPPQDNRLDIQGTYLTLLTANFDRERAAPGDSVHLTVMWRVRQDFDQSTVNYCSWALALTAPTDSQAATYWLTPPTTSWREGDVWRSQQYLLLPAALETGAYTWTVEWCSMLSEPIGQVAIDAPAHTYAAPASEIELDASLGHIATLVGAALNPSTPNLTPGTALTTTLVWRAKSTTTQSYHVFLHLLDPAGNLIAQSDGIPARWGRPTTGWLPGEYVTDIHAVTIPPDAPPGDYELLVGLYLPGGERLTTRDGSDAVQVTPITVVPPQ